MSWKSVWGCAASINDVRPEYYAKNITLRYPVKIAASGKKIRIRLSNFCGDEPVTIDRCVIARSLSDRETDESTNTPLLFGGMSSVTILSGSSVLCDSADFPIKYGDTVSVSFYLRDCTELRSATVLTGPLSKGEFSIGDFTCSGTLPLDLTRSTHTVYFLTDIELQTDDASPVVAFGDSITAGAWPDYLALKAFELGIAAPVIRKAASGTRILREYSCITYQSYGLMGKNRFCHELNEVAGAKSVIIQHGINDIIHPVGTDVNPFRPWSDLPTASQLFDGIKYYIECARDMGLSVYLGTLLPIEGWRTYAPFRDELRCEFNDMLRSTNLADGCIDFDEAVRNPSNPAAFLPEYDSGDHLHPSDAGYIKMAEAAARIIF